MPDRPIAVRHKPQDLTADALDTLPVVAPSGTGVTCKESVKQPMTTCRMAVLSQRPAACPRDKLPVRPITRTGHLLGKATILLWPLARGACSQATIR